MTSLNKQPLLTETEGDSDVDDFLDNEYTDDAHIKSDKEGQDQELAAFNQNVPMDKFNYTYLVFYLLGMATLLPWNFFLTAEDYWMYKFRNTSDNSSNSGLTPMQRNFTSDMSIAASVAGTIFLILNAIYSYKISLKLRMIGSMLGVLILFIINTSLVEVNTDGWQEKFFIITMVIVVLINCFAATLTGGLFGIAGLFPSEYMTAVVSGQALGGIFSSLALIVALTFGASAKTTAFFYFCMGNIFIVISIITYGVMSRTLFFKYYVYDARKTDLSQSQEALTEVVRDNQVPCFPHVFKKIYIYAVAECFVFVFTLSVYPAVTQLVQSQYHGNGHPWNDLYFTPVVNYLTFNSGDYLGRILAGLFEWPKNRPHLILLLTLIRAGFIPVLMMANSIAHNFLPVLIHSDIVFIALMICFSISNGYIANIALIMAPKAVMHHEKEMASSIMAACLGLGLTFGSSISLVLVHLL